MLDYVFVFKFNVVTVVSIKALEIFFYYNILLVQYKQLHSVVHYIFTDMFIK